MCVYIYAIYVYTDYKLLNTCNLQVYFSQSVDQYIYIIYNYIYILYIIIYILLYYIRTPHTLATPHLPAPFFAGSYQGNSAPSHVPSTSHGSLHGHCGKERTVCPELVRPRLPTWRSMADLKQLFITWHLPKDFLMDPTGRVCFKNHVCLSDWNLSQLVSQRSNVQSR